MSMSFANVRHILDEIAGTSSSSEKQAIIARHTKNDLFRCVVDLALNPYLTFKMRGNISAEGSKEPHCLLADKLDAKILSRLMDFSKCAGLSKEEKEEFADLVRADGADTVAVINKVLNKDLRCGASILTFRKASPLFERLPLHQPMKGIDDLEKFYKHAGKRSNICWSLKFDGTRTWAVVLGHQSVLYLSSNGHELQNFYGFDHTLIEAAKTLSTATGWRDVVFDGEVVNIQGDFSKHMSQFRRLKEMDPSGFRFRIFDTLPKDADDLTQGFSERYSLLKKTTLPMFRPGVAPDFLCSIVQHADLDAAPRKLARQAVDGGFEGIMLKTWNHQYQFKRTSNWCKIKFWQSEDLPVVGKVEGTGKHAGRLGALVVRRGDVDVEVGSGYTDADREEFWQNPPACIEVKYQDALASGSLRFPIFVRVRDDKDAQL